MIRSQTLPALLMTIWLTVLTGALFPLLVWGLSQLLFPDQSNGSLITRNGMAVGSSLIGQNFSSAKYFHPRPSAAGAGYDPLASSGTNLGPTSSKLISGIADDPATETDESYAGVEGLAKLYREENGLAATELVPVDAVTRSASGLDPHITPRNAELQAGRVAHARGMPLSTVKELMQSKIEARFIGLFGEPRLNVLTLNLALDEWKSDPK